MNYEKYIKYKNKYLQLKKELNIQSGGNNIFYIYTTGIADSGNIGENSIIDLWTTYICPRICSLIPTKYTQINILHCDILTVGSSKIEGKERTKIIEEIYNKNLRDYQIDNRINEILFQDEPLNFEEIKTKLPYLIIDIAHIFQYCLKFGTYPVKSEGSVEVIGYYPFQHDPIYLNVIHFSYMRPDDLMYSDIKLNKLDLIINNNFIKINPDTNIIITFTSRLTNRTRFPNNSNLNADPDMIVYDMIKDIINRLSFLFKEKYGNLNRFEELINTEDRLREIARKVMNDIMETERTAIQIKDLIIFNIVLEHLR